MGTMMGRAAPPVPATLTMIVTSAATTVTLVFLEERRNLRTSSERELNDSRSFLEAFNLPYSEIRSTKQPFFEISLLKALHAMINVVIKASPKPNEYRHPTLSGLLKFQTVMMSSWITWRHALMD